jgi:hypothetical protein
MMGLRHDGDIRGLFVLDVPFQDLEAHRAREAKFLALTAGDPLLVRVPLVYVLGAAHDG